jgi:hypothetical protein
MPHLTGYLAARETQRPPGQLVSRIISWLVQFIICTELQTTVDVLLESEWSQVASAVYC